MVLFIRETPNTEQRSFGARVESSQVKSAAPPHKLAKAGGASTYVSRVSARDREVGDGKENEVPGVGPDPALGNSRNQETKSE